MKSKLISSNGAKTYAVIFEAGDEAVSGLSRFAKEAGLGGSRLTAIGGFQDVILGYFELDKKDYKKIPLGEQVEVLSLVGDITLDKGEPKLHVHAVVGTSNGTARRASDPGACAPDAGSDHNRIAKALAPWT